jgi:beta-lactamase regulating signal transducer with metallopeptidase domain
MNALNSMSTTWSHWIAAAGWQAALVAAVAFFIVLLIRRRASSQLRHAVLLIVLLKFATPPFVTLPTGVFSQTEAITEQLAPVPFTDFTESESQPTEPSSALSDLTAATGPAASDPQSEPANVPAAQPVPGPKPHRPEVRLWPTLLMILHGCGVAVFSTLLLRRYLDLRRIVLRGEIVQEESLRSEVARIAASLRMNTVPQVRLSDDTDAPFAVGAMRPVIVLPRDIVTLLQPEQLAIVIAHELAHVRRRDLLIGWGETLVSLVWWFHPALWWLRKSLRQTREDCCDDVLLANNLAQPDLYCQTLIDAAARQTTAVLEPVALGFAHREHAAARRIRRLMDSALSRSDRLRRPAIVMTLLFGLIVLPGMRPERQDVSPTSLEGVFGRRNLPFQIDADEEAVLAECQSVAFEYFHTRRDGPVFLEDAARDRLEAVLKQRPGYFYAQYLLGSWHRMNGNLEEGRRLTEQALRTAPAVLTQRCHFGNDDPLVGVEIPRMEIECNRVRDADGAINQTLKLTFIGLITDANGEIHMPVYDTVYRLSSRSYPAGYDTESKSLGFFETNARIGVIPHVLVWKRWSRPRYFTRDASDVPKLSDAIRTESRTLTAGSNTYAIETVARAQADGTFTLDATSHATARAAASHEVVVLPDIENAAYVDHGIIQLTSPDSSRFDIASTDVLDSQTKIRLQSFQSGAGFLQQGGRVHLMSMWQPLPGAVDLVMDVHNYGAGAFRLPMAPQVGATVKRPGLTLTVTHMIAGHHVGWSSSTGFHGEPQSVASTSELMINLKGKSQERVSLWVVLKDGRRRNLKTGGWHSINTGGMILERISIPLDQIDHFEVLPYVEPERICFENVRLPARAVALQQAIPDVVFPVGGKAGHQTSKALAPLAIRCETLPGNLYKGLGSGTHGFELHERAAGDLQPDEFTTIKWFINAPVVCDYEVKFVPMPTSPQSTEPGLAGAMSGRGDWGRIGVECRGIPIDQVQAIRVSIRPMTVE